MDILAVIAACSMYPDVALLNGIGEAVSGNNDYVIRAHGDAKAYHYPDDLPGLLTGIGRLYEQGKEPVIGRYGIPATTLQSQMKSNVSALDTCENVHSASVLFFEMMLWCESVVGAELAVRESCALDEYAKLTGVKGANFRAHVLTVRAATEQKLAEESLVSPAQNPQETTDLQDETSDEEASKSPNVFDDVPAKNATSQSKKSTPMKAIRYRYKR